jgi:hypothetical protein
LIWAIVSDVHGDVAGLRRVLADAEAHGAQQFLHLGDVASTSALDVLNAVGAQHVFGNWEVSGWPLLPEPYQTQVGAWPAQVRADGLLAAHASPVWPAGLGVAAVPGYLVEHRLHWLDLFPSLGRSAPARQAALQALIAAGLPLFCHGHTHVQLGWRGTPDGAIESVAGPDFQVTDQAYLLIGVGSVGDPQDGPGACYALYDSRRKVVTWRRLGGNEQYD